MYLTVYLCHKLIFNLISEVQTAVHLLERLQGSLRTSDDPKLGVQCINDLNSIISVLHNPVLNRIVTIKVIFY